MYDDYEDDDWDDDDEDAPFSDEKGWPGWDSRGKTTVEIMQETLKVCNLENDEPNQVRFSVRYGKGNGEARIWLDNFPAFIVYLQAIEKSCEDPNWRDTELIEETHTGTAGEVSSFWGRNDGEEIQVYVSKRGGSNPGRGIKPLYISHSDLPSVIGVLEQAMEALISLM
jgi:hypothetical protein